MKVFVAGATGALGRRLVPRLVEAGHTVVGTTRTPAKADEIWSLGAEAVVVDALDRAAVVEAVRKAEPDVIVHQLTALNTRFDARNLDRTFAETDRLRTEGTDNLLEGARQAGVHRFVAQSFAGWPYARTGGWVKTEDDPLDPAPPTSASEMLGALKHLERAVLNEPDMEGIVLRYGGFYGPGTSVAKDGSQAEDIRRRRFPLVGDGAGVWSLVHVDDAAAATALAVERGAPGVYNIVDDDPAPVREWLPYLSKLLGAKPPRHFPVWLARLIAGPVAVGMMTQNRGASNAKAKRELGWRPAHPSWREGFPEALA